MRRKIICTTSLIVLSLLGLLGATLVLQLDFPEPTGPYPVGRSRLDWEDATRPEVLTDDPTDHRAIVAEVWYPAETHTGKPAAYFPDLDRVESGLVASQQVNALEAFGLRYIQAHDLQDAEVNKGQTAYPIVLFSPGNGTNMEFYSGIADELASQGYVVVGINHPYDVAAVELKGGRIAQFVEGPQSLQARQAWVASRIEVRTTDVLFTLQQLELLNKTTSSPYFGRLDLAHVGVMGHSLGGITAAEACRADARITACLNLDGLQEGGAFSTTAGSTPAPQPFLMITKEHQLPPAFIDQFRLIPGGSYRIVINGARHDSFTDGPVLLPGLLPGPNEADNILALTRTYTLAFFNQTLRGLPSTLLEKSFENRAITVEVYAPFQK